MFPSSHVTRPHEPTTSPDLPQLFHHFGKACNLPFEEVRTIIWLSSFFTCAPAATPFMCSTPMRLIESWEGITLWGRGGGGRWVAQRCSLLKPTTAHLEMYA